MVMDWAVASPFVDDRLPDSGSHIAAVVGTGDALVGWLLVETTQIEWRSGFARRRTTEDVIHWRCALSPDAPWDEGYLSEGEAAEEMGRDLFRYQGREYSLRWASDELSGWIRMFVLAE